MSPTRRQVLASIAGFAAASTVDPFEAYDETEAYNDIESPFANAAQVIVAAHFPEGAMQGRYNQWTIYEDLDGALACWRIPSWHRPSRVALDPEHRSRLVLTREQEDAIRAFLLFPSDHARPPVLGIRPLFEHDPHSVEFTLEDFTGAWADRWELVRADPDILHQFAPFNAVVTMRGFPERYLAILPESALSGPQLSPTEILGGAA